MRLLLLVLCAVADGSTCSCQPSSSSTDEQLQELAKWNCLRITQAGLDYSQLAQNYGQAPPNLLSGLVSFSILFPCFPIGLYIMV